MTQKRREGRESRQRLHDDDDDREYRGPRRSPRVETEYTFAVHGRPKPPEVRAGLFRLGDIVATSDGPHKVIEVFWITATKARVLLRPITKDEQPKRATKAKKTQPSKKFNVKGTQTSHPSTRKPARNKDIRQRK